MPISAHSRSASGGRYACHGRVRRQILNQFGSDTEDMGAIEAARPIELLR